MQPLLNLEQAAELLGYSSSGFRKLLAKDSGPRFMRVGKGQFRFRPEWLAEFVETAADAQKPGPTPRRKRPTPSAEPRHGF